MKKLILVLIYLVAFAGPNHAQEQSQEKTTEALSVRFIPNPVGEPTRKGEFYKWQYSTEVRNNLTIPLRITDYSFYFYEQGHWVRRNYDQRTFTSVNFTRFYAEGDKVVDGWIQPGEVAINQNNWTRSSYPITPRGKWVYTGEDSAGNVYYAETEIEMVPPVLKPVNQAESDFSRLILISGRVLDENDLAVAGAHLHLNNFHNREAVNTAVSGEDGSFSLQAPKSGLFRLSMFAVAHDRFSTPLMLADNDREVKIDIQLAPHDYDREASKKELPAVVFAEDNSVLKKIWRLDLDIQKEQSSHMAAMEEFREAYEDLREFSFDWSATIAILKNYMQDNNDPRLRQYAAVQLGQLPTRSGDIDAETILEIVEVLPPGSKLWSAAPYLPTRLARRYGMAMQQKFLKDFAKSNPDRVVRAMSLAQLAMMVQFSSDKETAALYYEKLKTEYGDVKEIQHQLSRLNPNKHVVKGKLVPDFAVELMDNDETISNKSLLGRFYLLDFWAVWCSPCVQEMKNLHGVYERFKDKNFSILSLSFDQKPDNVVKFRKEKWNMPWLNAYIEKGFNSKLAKKFEVFGIPKPILVGPDGLILEEGFTLRGETLVMTLSKYLEGSN